MPEARLHDQSTIAVEVHGRGPAVLLPVNPKPVQGPQAEELRRWGVDPALGRTLIDGLSDTFRVIAFDYEGQVMQVPKPDTLTPANVAGDLLAVADAAGADRFAYYGYSWLALAGLQLGIRSDRLAALVMGGFPPLDGPYAQMLKVTMATHEMAVANSASAPSSATSSQPSEQPSAEPPGEPDWSQVEVTLTEAQTRQFVTLYQALQDFDDRAAQARLGCPRLCVVGSADEIDYGGRPGHQPAGRAPGARLAGASAGGAGPHPGHAGRPCPAGPAPLADQRAGRRQQRRASLTPPRRDLHGHGVDPSPRSSPWQSASAAARTIPSGLGSAWPAPPRWGAPGRRREERKVVSVLFCDLVGFTAQADQADPEEVQARLGPTTTGPAARSSASAARWRSSSATRSSACSGSRRPTRTTRSGPTPRPDRPLPARSGAALLGFGGPQRPAVQVDDLADGGGVGG
jgi:hypothetical protein